jgi:Fe(3+) dicitrate transport protein
MKKNNKYSLLILSLLMATTLPVYALAEGSKSVPSNIKILDKVTVIGTNDDRENIAGSASIVSEETIDRFQITDVHRALNEVPGITIQEEDGFGLRPNIAIRGGRSNRSADLTLMEDGVLAAPAPYSAPEAYYFPQMDRMKNLEVIKGTGAIKYGPRTTNGVLNMVTKPIPSKKQAEFVAEGGSYGTYRTGATVGDSFENGGFLLNAYHAQSDGFKDLDFTGGDTGYNAQDIMGKFRLHTSPSAERYHELEVKLGYYNETSDETYLGLTDDDSALTPNRRYGSSQLDEMRVGAWQASATHLMELTPDMNLTTTLYRNEVRRSWYKLDSVQLGGVSRSLSSIFDNPTGFASYIDTLKSDNTSGGAFAIRDNNRNYLAQGVQSVLGWDYEMGQTKNKLEVGARYHTDEEDRFQRDDRFDMVGGQAVLTSLGTPGAAGNRIQSADAWSGFIQNELSWDKWTVTPGIRFEHIILEREEFGSADPTRSGSALTVFENSLDVWIPGIGVSYAVNDNWKLLGGVHKGFAPPGVPATTGEAAFTSEEESINYELGTRYSKGNWSGELFGFFTDYKNLLGRDTLSSGGTGTGDSFNGGQVEVKGIEAVAQYNAAESLGISSDFRVPVTASYTLTQGEFKNSFVSSFEEWGTVVAGDELPYVPKHQLYLSAGLEKEKWGVSAGAKYTDKMRTKAGSGAIAANRKIDSHWTVDVAGEYKVNDSLTAFTTIENVMDEEYVAARRPAGVRPGMPMTVMVGVKIALW